MPIVICKKCKNEFKAKPSWIKYGHGIYCSTHCQYEGRKNGKVIKCFICDKESYKQKKALDKSKSGKFFCSKSCQTKWRNQEFVGIKHANWKNGLSAYRSVLTRNKIIPVCVLCGGKDKRVLAVHHIDKDRKNNNVANLAWLCHNCHFLVHHDITERQKFISKRGKK